MMRAKDIIKQINDGIANQSPVSAKKILAFLSEAEDIQRQYIAVARTLSEGGFGQDDDDAQCDLISMLNSALADIVELRMENNALQSQIRAAKIFESTLSENSNV